MWPQVFKLFLIELEHEIGGEAALIAFHRMIEHFGTHSIKFRQINIQYHFVPSNENDKLFNSLHWYKSFLVRQKFRRSYAIQGWESKGK